MNRPAINWNTFIPEEMINCDFERAIPLGSAFQYAVCRSSIVSIANKKGEITFVNDNFVKISGYTKSELVGKDHRIINSGHHSKIFWADMWKTIGRGGVWREEVKNRAKGGSYYWVDTFIMPLPDEQGEIQGYISIRNDVTKRKTNEERITELNDRYEILSRATNDIVWDWNIVDDTVLYNQNISVVLGYDEAEIDNTSGWWDQRIHPEDHGRIMKEIKEGFDKRLLNWELSYRFRTATGQYKYIRDKAFAVYDMEGFPVRMIGAMQDLTELTEYRKDLEKKVEERTRELNDALQKEMEIVEMKSRFVSIASHEFRTPLASISLASGFIKKFKDQLSSEDIDRKLKNIETQVKHMTHLLDDLLTIGKAESGRIGVNLTTIKTKEIFEVLGLEVVNSTHRTHIVNLKINFHDEAFQMDEGLIRNIVINLLTNAIKFSPASSVVDLTVDGDSSQLIICIRDYGIGIPPTDIHKLFEPFYRAGNSGAIPGTGLGLSIVKKAVALLEGRIEVKSHIGEGTAFTVLLPLK